jgi:hypothetical protein
VCAFLGQEFEPGMLDSRHSGAPGAARRVMEGPGGNARGPFPGVRLEAEVPAQGSGHIGDDLPERAGRVRL